ncbi:MAG: amidohydrolase family protein [Ensifer adhaerens]
MGTQPLLIANASLITGDGITFIEKAAILIQGRKIVDVWHGDSPTPNENDRIIDAAGCTVIPGIINAHAHGCIAGPSMPSGSLPLEVGDLNYQRNRHLASGTTALLNVCGLASPDEIDGIADGAHPIDIHVTTAHTPMNVAAALQVDGKGLRAHHINATVDDMLARGAKALGEAGGGQTLGGGAQDYRFLPKAIEAACGVSVHPKVARAFKEAVLGKSLDGVGAMSDIDLDDLIRSNALDGHLSAKRLQGIVVETVMPPVRLALEGLEEIAAHSHRLQIPAIFHNATPTVNLLIRLAESYPRARMIAGHSNHPMFSPSEAVRAARLLRERGVTIDVSTLDCITTRWRNGPDNLDALIAEDLVDTLSTDFAGGDWDSMLSAIQRMITMGQLAPARAIALATGNVARAFPEFAGDRGFIENGKRADLAICDAHNLARVRHVIVNGRLVLENARIL